MSGSPFSHDRLRSVTTGLESTILIVPHSTTIGRPESVLSPGNVWTDGCPTVVDEKVESTVKDGMSRCVCLSRPSPASTVFRGTVSSVMGPSP